MSRYFRNYHAPAILSKAGKVVVLTLFAGLLGFGVWGAMNLTVEDSERAFIPPDSYLNDYLASSDKFFPSTGIDLFVVFEGQTEIYDARDEIATLDERISGKSSDAPYIAEPDSINSYRNVLAGLSEFLSTGGTLGGNITLGDDSWPTNEEDFVAAIQAFASRTGPGAFYAPDVAFSEDGLSIEAIRVRSEYVRLTKKKSNGNVIDDADRQVKAMDETRELLNSWSDIGDSSFVHSDKFLTIEGFKIIKKELFLNVGLSIAAVAVIVFFTVASPVTSLLITCNVAFCIFEILGFMYALGIVIDSVSVVRIQQTCLCVALHCSLSSCGLTHRFGACLPFLTRLTRSYFYPLHTDQHCPCCWFICRLQRSRRPLLHGQGWYGQE